VAGIMPCRACGARRPAWQPAALALLPVLGLHVALLLGWQGLLPKPGPASAGQPTGMLPVRVQAPVRMPMQLRIADAGKAPASGPVRQQAVERRLSLAPARLAAAAAAVVPTMAEGAADVGPARGDGPRAAGLLPLPAGPAPLKDLPAAASANPSTHPEPSPLPVSVPAPAVPVADAAPDLAAHEPALLQPPPLYATQLPPAARLQYLLRRGAVEVPATLDWQPDGEHYRLRLQGDGGETVGGAAGAARNAAALGWASQGALAAQGLAPQRHAEVHRGRERRAVNFQRDAGLVTYSAPLPAHPLLPGTQDRLSWLVQLAGVLQANPSLAEPGSTLQLLVVGTRGQPQLWHFDVRREPTHPYDVQVDIWLDPAQHHWPQRVRWLQPGSGQLQELRRVAGAAG
jgi:hypothetical protein